MKNLIIIFVLFLLPWLCFGQSLDISFESALVDAANRNDEYEVAQLLKLKVPVNSTGLFGTTALMRAAYKGNLKICKLLLENNADVNLKDIGGATALHIAARQGKAEVVELLIKHGANPEIKDKEGFKPIHRAEKLKHENVINKIATGAIDITKSDTAKKYTYVDETLKQPKDLTPNTNLLTEPSSDSQIEHHKEVILIPKDRQDNIDIALTPLHDGEKEIANYEEYPVSEIEEYQKHNYVTSADHDEINEDEEYLNYSEEGYIDEISQASDGVLGWLSDEMVSKIKEAKKNKEDMLVLDDIPTKDLPKNHTHAVKPPKGISVAEAIKLPEDFDPKNFVNLNNDIPEIKLK